MPTSRYERAARKAGYRAIAGLDEAGRGALFGPVFAAAVVLDPERPIRGLDDSKQLEPDRREVLAERIRERACAWAVGAADAFEIDRINIYQASRLAMHAGFRPTGRPMRLSAARRRQTGRAGGAKIPDPWRRVVLFDRGGVDPGQGPPGCRAGRSGIAFFPITA